MQQDNINQISALTIIGKGEILSDEKEIIRWSGILTEKHPNLHAFVEAQTTAVILVQVARYLYVNKFQLNIAVIESKKTIKGQQSRKLSRINQQQ